MEQLVLVEKVDFIDVAHGESSTSRFLTCDAELKQFPRFNNVNGFCRCSQSFIQYFLDRNFCPSGIFYEADKMTVSTVFCCSRAVEFTCGGQDLPRDQHQKLVRDLSAGRRSQDLTTPSTWALFDVATVLKKYRENYTGLMLPDPPLNLPIQRTSQQPLFSREWTEFFDQNPSFDRFEKLCVEGRLRGSRIRSVIWKVLLKSLPLDRREWPSVVSRSRIRYDKLKEQMVVDPHAFKSTSLDIELSNPLSQKKESPWQQYFDDCELRDCIEKDVKRTFNEVQFFRDDYARKLLSDILFVYAKSHTHISYKQGMHEILAPLLFTLYLDLQSFGHLLEQNGLSDLDQLDVDCLRLVLDPAYLENDAFDMFSQLMILLEGWYITAEDMVSKPTLVPVSVDGVVDSFCRNSDVVPNSEILRKLHFISHNILAHVDSSLYNHLNSLEIHPQLYGIRWLRLLFGREFPIHDVLYIWDVIFASRPPLSLVDYLFVAFLEQIRHLLIGSDYTTCLQYLMRYPPIVDVHSFVQLALHVKSPKKYAKPKQPGLSNYSDITVAGVSHPNSERNGIPLRPTRILGPTGRIDNIQDKKARETLIGKLAENIIEKNNSGNLTRGVLFKPSGYSSNEICLLKEQVLSLQTRLNNVNLIAKVAAKRIEICLEDILLMEGSKILRQRIATELRNISDQLLRSTVAEEWVRSVTIPDATIERGGVELAREAENLRSPIARSENRGSRRSVYGDRELIDMKQGGRHQTLFR